MKNNFKKILYAVLCIILAFSFAACENTNNDDDKDNTDKKPQTPTTEQYTEVKYTPSHSAENRFVNYASPSASLDAFLNEYSERHMRDNATTRIGNAAVGNSTRSAWREWDSLIGGWWDASAQNGTMSRDYATNDAVNKWLELDDTLGVTFPSYRSTVDNQGYVWNDVTHTLPSWGMGWAFPDYTNGGKAWDFASPNEQQDWTVKNENDFTVTVAASKLQINTVNAVNEIQIETDKLNLTPAYAPFLRLGVSFANTGVADLEDLYVEWITNDEPAYSADKRVAFSRFCTRGYTLATAIEQKDYAFPMYLHEKWGADKNRRITGLRITLKGEKAFRGKLAFDFVASDYDDRQPLNNCNYILAAKNNLEFSRDEVLLRKVLPNARKAMNFLYYTLGGSEGLISTEYLVGHYNEGTHELGAGIGNGYWDVDAFPTVNLYCNISYYNALVAMKYLEDMADNLGIPFESVQTANAQMNGYDTYTAAFKNNLTYNISECKRLLQTEFWNEETGRFHVGKYDGSDDVQDHGYVMFNEQMIASGIATEAQTESILKWINGERSVSGDNSHGADIYYYEFAPRFNTQDIQPDFVWLYSCDWDGNVQNGGTALHCAYYDIVAQAQGNVQKAYDRLTNIQKWFEKVKAAGGEGKAFYRAYYDTTSIPVQGNYNGVDHNGLIGVDCEFLEAALLMRAIPDAFFGMSTQYNGTLTFSPHMPDGLDWWRLENLTYAGYYYDVVASKYFVQISGVSEYAAESGQEAQLGVTFAEPGFKYGVYIDGVKTSAYSKKDGVVKVVVPFGNVKVEIKETV